MILNKITLIDICADICAKYKTRIKLKSKSRLMGALGRYLAILRIMPRKQWAKYSMGWSNVVYTSFKLGTSRLSYEAQLATVIHEHIHIMQQRRIRRFLIKYARSQWRAQFEREAYAVSGMVMLELTGEIPNARKYADMLRAYRCKKADRAKAEVYLQAVFSGRKKCHVVGRQCIAMIQGRK